MGIAARIGLGLVLGKNNLNMKRILISGIFIGLFIGLGTIAAIFYAKGYRITFNGNGDGKIIEGTGLLVATSRPDGARVLVNNSLTTATNNTINLQPQEYDIQIEKDGYLPWRKKIIIKNGLVSEANALLIPTAPKLEAVTTIGVSNVIMDANGSLLAYTVSSASATKNGVYVLNMNSRPLIFLGATGTQIVSDAIDSFSQGELTFSPDGKELLVKVRSTYYLLATDARNDNPQDVTNTLFLVERDWEQQRLERDKKLMDSLTRDLRQISTLYFKDISAAPSGDKLLYTASRSASLPFVLKRKVPSLNSAVDQRILRGGSVYVYDIKEDKNHLIFDASGLKLGEKVSQYYWYADSRHLIFTEGGKVNVVEYDGGNLTTVYNGLFLGNLIFPWPDGSSIAIITRLSSTAPYNLYRISLQ